MESRSLVSESLGILTAGIGVPMALLSRPQPGLAVTATRSSAPVPTSSPRRMVLAAVGAVAGSRSPIAPAAVVALSTHQTTASPLAIPAANVITLKMAGSPVVSSAGGGVAGSSHGGSGSVATTAPTPAASNAGPSANSATTAPPTSESAASSVVAPATLAPTATTSTTAPTSTSSAHTTPTGTGGGSFQLAALTSFANFPLYTLDMNAGSVFPSGTERLATLGANMDLRAQVRDTAVASYQWNTAGLTDATNIAGTTTAGLSFQWDANVTTAATNSASLTVTNASGQTETETFNFQVPAGSGNAGTGSVALPLTLAPDTLSAAAPAFAGHNVAVDANSGSLDTAISLPTYNPNVPAVVLSYDSVTANPQPIIVGHHALDPAQAAPSQVNAQLTFNGVTGATTSYNTSALVPGDIQQVAVQANASSLPTGRYAYSLAIGDVGSATTTTTDPGSATVINDAGSAFGAGWTLDGLETVVPSSGGVVLDLGSGGKSLWFANGTGSTLVDPAGEFSTLVANADGSYSRTLTDGSTIQFNPAGREVADVDTNGVAVNYGYDTSGRLSTITDHYGNVTTFAYAAATGLLATITDPAGRVTSFTHSGTAIAGVTLPDASTWGFAANASGQVTQVTDPNGKAVAVAYDAAGRVGSLTNPDSTTTGFVAAEERGFVAAGATSPAAPTLLAEVRSTETDPLGNVTDVFPDWGGLGLTTVTADPMGNVASIARDGNGLPKIAVDPLNRISQFAYDARGNLTATTNPDGSTTTATYNSFAEPLTTTDELGRTTSYTYDSHGNQTAVTDPLHQADTSTYSGTGQDTSDSTPGGGGGGGSQQGSGAGDGGSSPETTTYGYNAQDEVTSITDADGNVTTMTYDSAGDKLSVTDPNNHTTTATYDALGRVVTSTDALGHVTTMTYDSAGDKLSVTDPNNHTTTATYDALGRVVTSTDALGHVTTTTYDAAGNPTVVTDPLGHHTTTAYDAMGRVLTVTDADGGVTTYAYDADGREKSITDSDGNVTSYTYDADGHQTVTTDPNGYQTTLTFDADGEVTSQLDRDGRTTAYAYDSRGRQVTESWLTGSGVALETITHSYDAAGELTAVTDGTTTLGYTYDLDGRPLTVSTASTAGQPSVTLSSTYAADGALASLSDNLSSAGTTTYAHDAADRLTSLTTTYGGSGGPDVALGYDAAGTLTTITRTGGSGSSGGTGGGGGLGSGGGEGGGGPASLGTTITSTLTYDAANRLTAITDQAAGTTVDAQSYGYDAANRLTTETNAEGTVTYAYDNINELTGVSGARSESYSYDANGNRTMTGYATATNNETTSGAGYTDTYDHEGNLVTKTQTTTGNVWTYTWDYRNRLTAVVEKTTGGATLMQGTYTYDPVDRRIGVDETVSGVETKTWTVYNGVNPYADFTGSGTLLTRYLYGPGANQILARTSSTGTTAWYLTDHEGSVRAIVSTSGTVLDHVAYDSSYGNVTSESSPSNGDRFKFDGMAWDAAIGIYYDNARYYDPVIGRFQSQDPSEFSAGDLDLYRFAGNNSINFIDSLGLQKKVYDGSISGLDGAILVGPRRPPKTPPVQPPSPPSNGPPAGAQNPNPGRNPVNTGRKEPGTGDPILQDKTGMAMPLFTAHTLRVTQNESGPEGVGGGGLPVVSKEDPRVRFLADMFGITYDDAYFQFGPWN